MAEREDGESEEESEGEDPPLPPMTSMSSRASVSAEAFGTWNQRQPFVPPVYPKSPEQEFNLTNILYKSFLFHSLDAKDVQVVMQAMRGPLVYEANLQLITEGDSGDHLYVVESGSLACTKVLEGVNTVVKTCVAGDLFGELALLYNCPRKASVITYEQSVLWELDRETFNSIALEAVQRKRTQCTSVLRTVPLFDNLTQGEVENIIDALKLENYTQGHQIIRQGDVGDDFYMISEGQALATKVTAEQPEGVHYFHGVGDYFGELSLLTGEPRAATVTAYTPEVQVLSMDRATFKRLMGPVEEFLQRGIARYA